MASNVQQQLVKSLLFDVEAIPQDNAIEFKNSKNTTPLNVKVRVRKKDDGPSFVKKGIISIPRSNQPQNTIEKLRLASSDQTIMSFDMLLETDLEKKVAKKSKRNFFARCLGVQGDDNDDNEYTTSVNIDKDSISDTGMMKLRRPLLVDPNEEDDRISSSSSGKKDKIFGKCKPGGCLDPPFGEDRYAYQPQPHRIKAPATIINDPQENDTGKNTLNELNVLESVSVKTVDASHGNLNKSILSMYHDKQVPGHAVIENDLDSIITYPPALSSSGPLSADEKNEKNALKKKTEASRNSFNKHGSEYFSPPRGSKESSKIDKKMLLTEEILPPDHKKLHTIEKSGSESGSSNVGIKMLADRTKDYYKPQKLKENPSIKTECKVEDLDLELTGTPNDSKNVDITEGQQDWDKESGLYGTGLATTAAVGLGIGITTAAEKNVDNPGEQNEISKIMRNKLLKDPNDKRSELGSELVGVISERDDFDKAEENVSNKRDGFAHLGLTEATTPNLYFEVVEDSKKHINRQSEPSADYIIKDPIGQYTRLSESPISTTAGLGEKDFYTPEEHKKSLLRPKLLEDPNIYLYNSGDPREKDANGRRDICSSEESREKAMSEVEGIISTGSNVDCSDSGLGSTVIDMKILEERISWNKIAKVTEQEAITTGLDMEDLKDGDTSNKTDLLDGFELNETQSTVLGKSDHTDMLCNEKVAIQHIDKGSIPVNESVDISLATDKKEITGEKVTKVSRRSFSIEYSTMRDFLKQDYASTDVAVGGDSDTVLSPLKMYSDAADTKENSGSRDYEIGFHDSTDERIENETFHEIGTKKTTETSNSPRSSNTFNKDIENRTMGDYESVHVATSENAPTNKDATFVQSPTYTDNSEREVDVYNLGLHENNTTVASKPIKSPSDITQYRKNGLLNTAVAQTTSLVLDEAGKKLDNLESRKSGTVNSRSRSRESIFLNLAFQTYSEENQTTVRTLNSTEDKNLSNVILVKSLVRTHDETGIFVPLDSKNVMKIGIMPATEIHEQEKKQNKLRYPKPSSKLDPGKSEYSNSTSSDIRSDPHSALSLIFNQELIPLQSVIKDLKEDIDSLAAQQIMLRNRLEQGTKRLKPVFKKCNCPKRN